MVQGVIIINANEMHLILKFSFDKELYISDTSTVHHQESQQYIRSNRYSSRYLYCFPSLADRRHNYRDKYQLLRIQC